VGLGEVDPFGGHPIDVRRLDHRVAIDAQTVGAMLVDVYQQDIGPWHSLF
jgi:hypothetical protein